MTKRIPLTRGKFAVVDDCDYRTLVKHSWHAKYWQGHWYAARIENRKYILMHREILCVTDPKVKVDHRDNDGLNNRRSNIRTCTHAENMHNRAMQKNNSTGFKGVSVFAGKFQVKIRVNGKLHHVGFFGKLKDAAKAYDEAAKKYFGEFASPNFPLKG